MSEPKQQTAPRPEPRGQGPILIWLDALAGGHCTPKEFLRAMHEQFPAAADDGNWEILALIDQYFRLGKISAEVFQIVKSGIEDSAFGAREGSARDAAPTATEAVYTPVRTSAAGARAPSGTDGHASNVDARAPNRSASGSGPHTRHRDAFTTTAPVDPSEPADLAARDSSSDTVRVTPISAAPWPAPQSLMVPRLVASMGLVPPPTAPPADADPDSTARPSAADAGRATPQDIGVGDVLRGRYRIRRLLGQGGMGTVFEATDAYRLDLPGEGQRVAIKVLHSDVAKREELLAELQVEFQLLQALSHPNIVRVHEFDRDRGIAFLTMELLSGTQLSRILSERNSIPLPRRYSFALIRDLGAALVYAHEHGVVHGDIKPQNIFVTNDGELRVLDFGATSKLNPVATPGYASCQVLEGHHPDRRDDVFSFACVAYVLVSGRHPFDMQSALQARLQRMRPSRPAGLSGRQWRALREGLRWDRDARPGDMRAWLARLDLRGAATRIASLPALLSAAPERKSYALRAAAVIFAALLIGLGYWATSDQDLTREGAALYAQLRDKVLTLVAAAGSNDGAASQPDAGTAAAPPPQTSAAPPAPAASPSSTASAPATSPAATAPARVASTSPAATAPAHVASTSPAATPPAHAASMSAAAAALPPAHTVPASAATSVSAPAHPASAAPLPPASASSNRDEPRAANPAYTKVEMVADTVDTPLDANVAQVTIRRHGSLRGDAAFTLWTESGTAKPGKDFTPIMPHVEQIRDGAGTLTVSIPISNVPRTRPVSFYVVIDQSDAGPPIAGRRLTMITLGGPEE
ncbi:MAG TPA: protein kinase [Steroidobacteraceae bacterium]|nr:protein kinase [Steroidobacteraceae bacterium]